MCVAAHLTGQLVAALRGEQRRGQTEVEHFQRTWISQQGGRGWGAEPCQVHQSKQQTVQCLAEGKQKRTNDAQTNHPVWT